MTLDALIPSSGKPAESDSRLWSGVVLETATGLEQRVRVSIPSADNERHVHGPCRWMPRGDLFPSAGDPCLVVFDDDGEAWIPAWVPS